MTERRPFPPSPRRLALARQAGLTAASPLLVGALAVAAAVVASIMLARAAASLVGQAIASACDAAARPADVLLYAASTDAASTTAASTDAGTTTAPRGEVLSPAASAVDNALARMSIDDVAPAVLELGAPLLAAIALVAFVVHVAQTRAVWLPRRRIHGAPALAPARTRHATFEIASASIIGVVAFGWLWTTAPRLAGLFALPLANDAAAAPRDAALDHRVALAVAFDRAASSPVVVAIASAIASFVVALAIAWLALAVLDALARRLELAHSLAMTVAETREDERLAAADPRWRAQRLALARSPSAREAIARSTLLLLGDNIAVAIAYDVRRHPIPLRTITGRRARATQLLGLARRHRIAVHRDPALAAALVDGDGPVPDTYWRRLADIIAAVQRIDA